MDGHNLDVVRFAELRQTLLRCAEMAGDDPRMREVIAVAIEQQKAWAAVRLRNVLQANRN